MSALRMHAITGILGAALAGGVASLAPFAFMDAMAPWPASHAALAGGAYGCLASIMLGGGRSALGASVSRALALANPLILVCLAAPGAALALIAAFILWRGVFALAAFADHRGAVGMALALVAAPIVSPLALGAYPALVPALAALSPWRPGARRLAGFYFVVLAPAAMLLAGAGYFAWLYSLPVMALAPPQPEWDAIAFRKFVPLLAAPGILLAALAVAPGAPRWRAAVIFLAIAAGCVVGAGALGVPSELVAGATAAAQTAWATCARRPLPALFFAAAAGGLLLAHGL